MAVTVSATRTHSSYSSSVILSYITLTLSGTYVTGGFAFNPLTVKAGPGSSPLPSATVIAFEALSQAAYDYYLVGAGSSAVIKIFTPAGAELANTTAVPEATLLALVHMRKLG